jgi:hypothetical protein
MKEKVDATRTESPMSHASLMGRAAPMERTDSNDRPLDRPSGPPRLNLAGGKPSWREWEAAKGAAGDSASGSSPTGPSSFECHHLAVLYCLVVVLEEERRMDATDLLLRLVLLVTLNPAGRQESSFRHTCAISRMEMVGK